METTNSKSEIEKKLEIFKRVSIYTEKEPDEVNDNEPISIIYWLRWIAAQSRRESKLLWCPKYFFALTGDFNFSYPRYDVRLEKTAFCCFRRTVKIKLPAKYETSLRNLIVSSVFQQSMISHLIIVKDKKNKKDLALQILSKSAEIYESIEAVKTRVEALRRLTFSKLFRTLLASIETDNNLILCFEHVRGSEDLGSYVKDKMIRPEWFRLWLAMLCLAVSIMHKEGIIHRDIKLENIILNFKTMMIKVSGFALCTTKKMPFDIVGSRRIMAPEIFEAKGYDKAVDWWSVGIVAADLLLSKPLRRLSFSKSRLVMVAPFRAIEIGLYEFPEDTPIAQKLFIVQLLQPVNRRRLGSGCFKEIEEHPYFKDKIHWESLKRGELPPIE